jgi:SAM-dependent methyltransferase
MRPRLVDLLACPRCAGPLQLKTARADGEEVLEGQLACPACAADFPIVAGVPRFIDAEMSEHARRTVDRFGEQWQEFDFVGDYDEQQFLAWIAPNTPAVFAGQTVLDAGCGKGRHAQLAARFGARDVLAVDRGSAVEAAYRNTRALPNVHVIQADLFHLPVAPGVLDVAYSIGVLHHTSDPQGAFNELTRRLRPGGRIIVWVYGRENNGWVIRFVDPLRTNVTSRLPHRLLYHLSKLPAALLYVLSRGVYVPLGKPPFGRIGRRLWYHAYIRSLAAIPFRGVHLIVHDHLGPPIACYIERKEFESWFREGGLAAVDINWHNQNSWRGTATRPLDG